MERGGDGDGAQAGGFGDGTDAVLAGGEGLLDGCERADVPEGAEGVGALSGGLRGHDGRDVFLGGRGGEGVEGFGRQPGEVAGQNEVPVGAVEPERGFDAAKRAAAGVGLIEGFEAERGVAGGCADEGDGNRERGCEGGQMGGQGPAGEGQKGFVPAHAPALATGENERRAPHDLIVARRFVGNDGRYSMKCGYNQNISGVFCYIAAFISILAAATPALAEGQRSTPAVKSVVRADTKSGRLVRSISAPRTPRATEPEAKLGALIDQTAERHAVDPKLVRSVIQVESNFNPYAVSPKGAQGLMQLIPATARRFGVANPFDAAANLEAGVKYLKYLKELFQDERLALAAYNAGEGAVQKYGGVPPYAETQEYVEKIRRLYGTPKPAAAAPPEEPGEPKPRGLDAVMGPDGRVYLRSR